VARMGIKLHAYRVLVRNPGRKMTLVSPRHIKKESSINTME